jgi:hypothetical protein
MVTQPSTDRWNSYHARSSDIRDSNRDENQNGLSSAMGPESMLVHLDSNKVASADTRFRDQRPLLQGSVVDDIAGMSLFRSAIGA